MAPHIRPGFITGRNSIELRPVADAAPGHSPGVKEVDWAVRAGCTTALLATFPIVLLAGFAVMATSAGPTITRSPSMGADGRIVFLRQFRTTYRDNGGQDVPASSGIVTPVGRFLRLSGIARLPMIVDGWMGKIGLRAASGP